MNMKTSYSYSIPYFIYGGHQKTFGKSIGSHECVAGRRKGGWAERLIFYYVLVMGKIYIIF